jgi:hypothetical protein
MTLTAGARLNHYEILSPLQPLPCDLKIEPRIITCSDYPGPCDLSSY